MPWAVSFALLVGTVVVLFAMADLHRRYCRRRLYARLRRRRGFAEGSVVRDTDVLNAVPEMAVSSCRVTRQEKGLRLHVFENLEHDVEPGGPTETQTMIAVDLGDVDMPHFVIDPRSVPLEVQMKIEMREGITISGDDAFAAYNVVTAKEPERVRRLLRDAAITPLLYSNRSLTVESRGRHVVFYDAEHLMSEGRILQICDAAATFADRLRQVLKTGKPADGPVPPPIPKEDYTWTRKRSLSSP